MLVKGATAHQMQVKVPHTEGFTVSKLWHFESTIEIAGDSNTLPHTFLTKAGIEQDTAYKYQDHPTVCQ